MFGGRSPMKLIDGCKHATRGICVWRTQSDGVVDSCK